MPKEKVEERQELRDTDTEITIEGNEIAETIWEKTPGEDLPTEYRIEDNWTTAR